MRGGIMSVANGQTEAGRSLGLSYRQTMIYIILPQAIKNVLPALANEFITLIKETSICGYIGLMDLTRGGDIIRSQTYEAFLPLIAVAIIYLIIVEILTVLVGKWEKSLRKSER
jgi:polar amino acid transport system substrate-binding protein